MPTKKPAPKKLHPVLVDKLPTGKPAELADLLYTSRETRLAENKTIVAIEEQEKAIKNWFIENLSKSSATGVAGKVGRVTVTSDTFVPQVEDWEAVYKWIWSKKAWDLLPKSLNAAAVQERWDDPKVKEIPGVKKFCVTKVSCVKV